MSESQWVGGIKGTPITHRVSKAAAWEPPGTFLASGFGFGGLGWGPGSARRSTHHLCLCRAQTASKAGLCHQVAPPSLGCSLFTCQGGPGPEAEQRRQSGRKVGFESRQTWVLTSPLPLSSCVTWMNHCSSLSPSFFPGKMRRGKCLRSPKSGWQSQGQGQTSNRFAMAPCPMTCQLLDWFQCSAERGGRRAQPEAHPRSGKADPLGERKRPELGGLPG